MSTSRPTKRARKAGPEISPDDVIEIDPKGDLVLKVGSKQPKLMRVSSKHMTTVSKVFDALLSPRFREGQTHHDESNPLELPDDQAEAMELMCKLAHHKISKASTILASRLQALVVVCDKYDCLGPFAIHFNAVLSTWLQDFDSWGHWYVKSNDVYLGLKLLDALCLSFLAGDAKSFERISQLVFKMMTGEQILTKISKCLVQIMPTDFRGNISHSSTRRGTNVCSWIEWSMVEGDGDGVLIAQQAALYAC